MASRLISDLSPAMQILCGQHLARCAHDPELLKRGAVVILTCTYRSNEEQDQLYAQGRTLPGAIVTNARSGQSAHNRKDETGHPAAEAFDVAIIENGKLIWNDSEAWALVGAQGIAVGLKWYGSAGARFPEKPHFQNPEV